ncbi:acyl-CoA dehydrogenase family protein [Mycolicibacter sinensis]|uniref:Acyl-CoA dehydrogenase/oxidase C-terminal domain-containing protein n=1 Tax=Mycolicibacter sinensis (strain JDM601) TaxID=875328 RepID=A0A1A2EBJ3_MYCSD|nr:acyl-CoA dehydrogenase family protein [Mycolicibacter sinensis]OBG02532.1 hypothetical protein A5772_07280 [Mycolicibacter sinensis]OBG03096.1 hypothetical protein A5771_14285 [Mycolicibacter sinensis]
MSSDLLDDLRGAARQALSRGGGHDVVDQLDLAGLLIDAAHGGLGMTEREMVVVGEELGRNPVASSFLPAVVLATTLLTEAGATDLLASATEKRHAVALAGLVEAASGAVAAAKSITGQYLLQGSVWALTTPVPVEELLIAAAIGETVGLLVVDIADVRVTPANELDPQRGLVCVELDRAPASLVADDATAAVRAGYRRALLAVAAEQLGVARACLEMSVDYARTRTQFGAPIGSFQAIKHRLAETLLDVELAAGVLEQAVSTRSIDDAELAFVVGTRAATSAAESAIHIHGGTGFTWEHSAHWYLRRARVNATLLGSAGAHREAIAASAGITSSKES